MEPAPLTAVALVFRSKSKFAGLPHVVSAVSLFLDTLVEVPLRAACKFESVVLLDRIWSYSDAYGSNFTGESAGAPRTIRKYLRTYPHYRQYQFTKSMMEAVRLRNVEMVHWLASKFPEATVMMKVVAQASSSGSLEILQVFYDRCAEDPCLNVRETLLVAGVRSRSTEVVEWLYAHAPSNPAQQSTALEAAVCSGSIAMVEWLLAHGATWWTRNLPTLRSAHFVAEGSGSVEMLQWLDEHGQLDGLIGLVTNAAGSGFIDAVRWLLDRGMKDSTQLEAEIRFGIHSSASNGHLSLAKYLQSRAYFYPQIISKGRFNKF